MIETHIEINASPELVRSVFLDFDQYSDWNPFIKSLKVISGDLNNIDAVPTTLQAVIAPPGAGVPMAQCTCWKL